MADTKIPTYPSVEEHERAKANILSCGSLRMHDPHTWTGQQFGESLHCPGRAWPDSEPVKTLRAAADLLRDLRDDLPERFRPLADPVADWLDHAARARWAAEWAASAVNGVGADDIDRDTPVALAVAKAVLGEGGAGNG